MTVDSTTQWADIKKYEDILAKDPRSYCFAPLADLYRKLGLLEDALSTAQKGCAVHPNYAAGQMALGLTLMAKSDISGARRALEKVVQVTPDNLEAQRLLGQLYIESGEYAAAENALSIILSLVPNDTECRLIYESLPRSTSDALGDIVEPSRGDDAVPSGVASQPLEESWEAEEILDLTDEVLELEEADEELTEAPGTTETVPVVTATMAELYVQQGFVTQAIGIYETLLAADPANESLRNRLAELSPPPTQMFAADISMPAVTETEYAEPQARESRLIATLEKWLVNVRRLQECRSKSA